MYPDVASRTSEDSFGDKVARDICTLQDKRPGGPRERKAQQTPLDPAAAAVARAAMALQLFPGLVDACPSAVQDAMNLLPQNVPPGVDIQANLRLASQMGAAGDVQGFYNAVRNGGGWDYKQEGAQYADFGNWHFGLVAKAFGWPVGIARRGAGLAQMCAGTAKRTNGHVFTQYPYRDADEDEKQITNGFRSFDRARDPIPRASCDAEDKVSREPVTEQKAAEPQPADKEKNNAPQKDDDEGPTMAQGKLG